MTEKPGEQPPELLPPEPLLQPNLAHLGLACAAGAVLALGVWSSGVFSGTGTGTGEHAAQMERLAAHARLHASHSVVVPISHSDAEVFDAAIAQLKLPDLLKQKVRNRVVGGELKIGVVLLWDFKDQDGDRVRLVSGGVTQSVVIRHKPTPVPIPYLSGQRATLIGEVDGGGGGITVAAATRSGPVNIRPIGAGDSVEISTQ